MRFLPVPKALHPTDAPVTRPARARCCGCNPTLLKKMPMALSLVVLWVLSFLFGRLPLILPSLQRGNYTGNCGLLYVAKSEYLYATCFGTFAPSLLVRLRVWAGSIAYVQHTRLQHACAQAGSLALRTVLIVLVGFSLSWGPHRGGTVQAACSSCNPAGPLKDALFLLGETNSPIDPPIYSLYSKDIRSHLAKPLRCRMKAQAKPLASNILTVGSWGGGQPEVPGS
ncbi:LOW QUALITY PROTEIN: glucose-dependent insulinotropic receptor-like [Theristicus caerulescens]